MNTINFIFFYIKKQFITLWMGILFTVIAGLVEVSYPFLIQEITNVLLSNKTVFNFTFSQLLIITALLSLTIILCHMIIIFTEQKVISAFGYHLRKDIYHSVLRAPWARIRQYHTGRLAFRIKNDTALISDRVRALLGDLIYDLLTLIGPFIAMLFINVTLAFMVAGSIILASIIINPVLKKSAIYERALQIYNAKFSGHLQESFSWIKTIKIFRAEESEAQRISTLNNKVKNSERAAGMIMSLAIPLGYAAQFTSTLVVLGYGGKLLMDNAITPGSFVAVFVWEQLMADSIKRMGKYVSIIYSLNSLVQRVSGLLTAPVVSLPVDKMASDDQDTAPEVFLHLRLPAFYWHDGRLLLNNIHLDLHHRETILLLGENGTGKSTLLDILLRLHPIADDASLILDGRGSDQWTESDWLTHFTLMNQHTQLIKGSLRENLTIARITATDDELSAALIAAGGETLLQKCHGDLSTLLDEKGSSLSGGERQIIGLTRVLLNDAPIVFFDEPTTHLDRQKVEELITVIQRLARQKTLVIISHDSRLFPLASRFIEIRDGTLTTTAGLNQNGRAPLIFE